MVAVVLMERIEKLGQMGQVVNVKPGFARKLPAAAEEEKAMRATKANLAYSRPSAPSSRRPISAARRMAETVAGKLNGLRVVVIPPGRRERSALWLGVVARHIAQAVTEGGFTRAPSGLCSTIRSRRSAFTRCASALHPEPFASSASDRQRRASPEEGRDAANWASTLCAASSSSQSRERIRRSGRPPPRTRARRDRGPSRQPLVRATKNAYLPLRGSLYSRVRNRLVTIAQVAI